ncbi:MAG TPA: glycosyltransferase family 39 protein [Caulobacteraceae bacterium]|nr:glycosyltransferase family 39 protein [Caulobacteraceae bacterium]
MTLKELTDRITAKGRGPLFAAAVALLAGLLSVFTLPPTDRDESRFAEASAQMLESGDFTAPMFQDQPRFKKPVGIYWLQAASVKLASGVERRDIWAYRVPSLLGAGLAAAACAWGAAAFLRPWAATMAGAILGCTTALSTEATIATTDAALCGAITLSMAALGRIYLAEHAGPAAGRWTKLLFWLGLAASILLKGPVGPMVAFLTIVTLVVWERKARWLRGLGWAWGLIVVCAVVLPWALAITVATDGAFWGMAVGSDLAPKLVGGQEGHGEPPGYFLLLAPVLLFPAVLLLPAAAVAAWRRRAEPGVRFALAWLIPSWLAFEIVPTKLPHYVLPTFGAIVWLMAAALAGPMGPRVRWIGVLATLAVAVGITAAGGVGAWLFGDWASWVWLAVAGLLYIAVGVAGGVLLGRERMGTATGVACGLALVAHGVLLGGFAPTLSSLWLSQRVAESLARANLNPRQGLVEGPVSVAGYAEPSLVFALGASTVLGGASDAAQAIDEGRPAVVASGDEAAFQAALRERDLSAKQVGAVSGLDYSSGHPQVLRLYEAAPEPPVAAARGAGAEGVGG